MDDRQPYENRVAAGRDLATRLGHYAGRDDVAVLALPRGGLPVAAPIAEALTAPLDVVIVRKLGLPGQAELAMGAVAALGGTVQTVRNERVIGSAGVSPATFDEVQRRELAEVERRQHEWRADRLPLALAGRVAIVVDDGLATGSTVRAAVAAVRRLAPQAVVVAVPIGARRTCGELAGEVDELLCPWQPEPFWAVGQGYRDFSQVPDEQAQRLLHPEGR